MEAQTRFCTTPDGARIAFVTFGQGPSLVIANGCWLSVSHDIDEGIGGPFYRTLAQNHTVTLYDRRGTGLSDRERTEFTAEADASDLAAIVNHLGIERFALLGNCALGGAAITYATRNPEKVSELILYAAWAYGPLITRGDLWSSFVTQARSHWGLSSRNVAGILVPESDGAMVDRVAVAMRESCDGETAARFLEMMYKLNVTDLLSEVTMPTLVLQRRHDRGVPFRSARELCASLPNARLVGFEGHHHLISYGDFEVVTDEIQRFLGSDVKHLTDASQADAHVHTILFTDMEGSTSLTQRLGDAAAQNVLRTHNSIVRDALTAHSGTEIKHTGDGIMASFTSASAALEAAVAIQMALAVHRSDNPESTIRVRIGLNAGEPVAEDEDLFGTAVQLAARVCDKAEPGQILVADVVEQLAAGKGFTFVDNGEASLKGFERPVRLHEVRWHD